MFSLSYFFLHRSWGMVKTPMLSSSHDLWLSTDLIGFASGWIERQGWDFVSPSLGLDLSYHFGIGGDKKNWFGWNDLLFEIFVYYHNFNEISVLPTKMWGEFTGFIIIHSLYCSRFIPWVSHFSTRKPSIQ